MSRPTLDIPSAEVLEAALEEFNGAVLVISHDCYFPDRIYWSEIKRVHSKPEPQAVTASVFCEAIEIAAIGIAAIGIAAIGIAAIPLSQRGDCFASCLATASFDFARQTTAGSAQDAPRHSEALAMTQCTEFISAQYTASEQIPRANLRSLRPETFH